MAAHVLAAGGSPRPQRRAPYPRFSAAAGILVAIVAVIVAIAAKAAVAYRLIDGAGGAGGLGARQGGHRRKLAGRRAEARRRVLDLVVQAAACIGVAAGGELAQRIRSSARVVAPIGVDRIGEGADV